MKSRIHALVVFVALLLVPSLLSAEDQRLWSAWQKLGGGPNSSIEYRLRRDDNGGQGFGEGKYMWWHQFRNTSDTTVSVFLAYYKLNRDTRKWENPKFGPTPTELKPGEMVEGWDFYYEKDNFDFSFTFTGHADAPPAATTPTPQPSPGLNAGNEPAPQQDPLAGLSDEQKVAYWRTQTNGSGGDAKAMNELGHAYAFGIGVAKDPAAAFKWWELSAGLGNPDGMAGLAWAYHNAFGWPAVDDGKAFVYWKAAAEKGHPGAMSWLASAYHNGWGVERDDAVGAEWDLKAVSFGKQSSMINLYYAYHNGLGIAKDESLAREWLQKAVSLGSPQAIDIQSKLNAAQSRQQSVSQYSPPAGSATGSVARSRPAGFQETLGYLAGELYPYDAGDLKWVRDTILTENLRTGVIAQMLASGTPPAQWPAVAQKQLEQYAASDAATRAAIRGTFSSPEEVIRAVDEGRPLSSEYLQKPLVQALIKIKWQQINIGEQVYQAILYVKESGL